MNAFEIYRDKLIDLHRLTSLECEGQATIVRDSEANAVRSQMERLWVELSMNEQMIARKIACELGHRDESLCMVVFAHNEGDMIKLHVFDDKKYDDWLTAKAGSDYHVFELIGYDYFIKPGAYPLSQFKDHPRVKEYLKKR